MKSKGDTTYDPYVLEDEALQAIQKYKLTQVDDIVAFVSCSRATFYNHKIDKLDSIREAVLEVKIKLKQGIKKKWYERENTQAEKYLYLLLGTQEERDALNGTQKIQESGKVEIEIIDKTIKKVGE